MSKISLSESMNLVGQTIQGEAQVEADSFEYLGNKVLLKQKNPVQYTIDVRRSRKLLFKAETQLVFIAPCDRCLEDVEVPFDVNLEILLQFDENGILTGTEDGCDDVSYINGYDLDVDGMVQEEVMIGFPMKVLCSEECKGLCPNCGANLNECECGCYREVLDPRMSIIRDLFRQQGSLSDDKN